MGMTGVRSSDIIPLLNMQLVEKGGNANILGGIQRLEVHRNWKTVQGVRLGKTVEEGREGG